MRHQIAAEKKIGFRVIPEEREIIEDNAKNAGLSVAEYCRRAALDCLSGPE